MCTCTGTLIYTLLIFNDEITEEKNDIILHSAIIKSIIISATIKSY